MKNISSKKNSTLTRLNEWILLSDPRRSKWKIIEEVPTGQPDSHLCQLEQLLVEMIKHTSSKKIRNSGNRRIVKAQEDEHFEHIELLSKKVHTQKKKQENKQDHCFCVNCAARQGSALRYFFFSWLHLNEIN